MKKPLLYILLFLCSIGFSQKIEQPFEEEQDTSIVYSIYLRELNLSGADDPAAEERRRMEILKRRVFRVYPFAKLTSENLIKINETMAGFKTNKEKKKYFKIVEDYLTNEFEPKLKKLSKTDGKILVKLIYRQTGQTTFDLIKEYKSGWKAFWANSTAMLFDIDLKENYDPYSKLEDFYIESILIQAFNNSQLAIQPPAIDIDNSLLAKTWREKIEAKKAENE